MLHEIHNYFKLIQKYKKHLIAIKNLLLFCN